MSGQFYTTTVVLLRSPVMKAVVTGSAGFIGRHLVDELIARGYRVTGVDRQSRSSGPRYEHVSIDLADHPVRSRMTEVTSDADLVFHLAGQPGVRGNGPGVDRMRERDNVVATRNLLSILPAHIPVVATSSSSVYGGSAAGIASREDDPLRPRGGYARSKVAMEQICEERRAAGCVVAVIRPFTVAGEGQRPDMAFSSWLYALRRGDPLRIFGSEARSRDITDVRDLVEGLIRAGERGVNETVNVGTGVSHRLIDMARTLLEVCGISGEIVCQPTSVDEVHRTLADTTRCRRVLGFVPSTDIAALLARQAAASAPLAMVGT